MGCHQSDAAEQAARRTTGIAGEDDIDAPDLKTATAQTSGAEKLITSKNGHLKGSEYYSAQQILGGRRAKAVPKPAKPILAAEASAVLRDQLADCVG